MFWCLISLGRRGQLTLLTCMYSLKIEMLLFSKFLLGFSNFQKQLAKLFNFCHSKMENGVPRNASLDAWRWERRIEGLGQQACEHYLLYFCSLNAILFPIIHIDVLPTSKQVANWHCPYPRLSALTQYPA
ncbi:hypothetical protein GmHk_08G023059 [Glycine max]|nr:hypothetical protein GmHk_08G023059 [Glycine max]